MHTHGIDWHLAAAGAGRKLRAIGLDVTKADPLDDDDFVAMSDKFAKGLSATSGPIDARAVKSAIDALNVPWTEISAAEQAAIIATAAAALGVQTGQKVWKLVSKQFTGHARLMVGRTKVAVGRQINFRITASFDAVDQNIVDNAMKSQGFYVTSEYARHSALFSRQAQDIAANGLAQGLRSEEIARDMAAAARAVGIKRTDNYWKVTSYAFSNRTRTHTQMARYAEAGIERYEFMAVVDERTTDICRALDGRTFAVQDGLRTYQDVEDDPHFDGVKDHQPWVRSRRNPNDPSEIDMFIRQRSGQEIPVGTVTRSGVGRVDDKGAYRNLMSDQQLAQFGLIQPPLHGLCRSVIVPVTS